MKCLCSVAAEDWFCTCVDSGPIDAELGKLAERANTSWNCLRGKAAAYIHNLYASILIFLFLESNTQMIFLLGHIYNTVAKTIWYYRTKVYSVNVLFSNFILFMC